MPSYMCGKKKTTLGVKGETGLVTPSQNIMILLLIGAEMRSGAYPQAHHAQGQPRRKGIGLSVGAVLHFWAGGTSCRKGNKNRPFRISA